MTEAVHVVGEVSAEDLRARSVLVLCGERIPRRMLDESPRRYVGKHKLVQADRAKAARWFELVTCEGCKAALAQEALEGAHG